MIDLDSEVGNTMFSQMGKKTRALPLFISFLGGMYLKCGLRKKRKIKKKEATRENNIFVLVLFCPSQKHEVRVLLVQGSREDISLMQ
ncbi:hypothetical protein, partial [Salmonella sp. s60732]|uniref:hypothetical protein n=1 Tax=Salmonella sp. s60732 TaxID=3160132 RepID=UPI003754732B